MGISVSSSEYKTLTDFYKDMYPLEGVWDWIHTLHAEGKTRDEIISTVSSEPQYALYFKLTGEDPLEYINDAVDNAETL